MSSRFKLKPGPDADNVACQGCNRSFLILVVWQVRRFFFAAVPLEAADKMPAARDEGPHQARLAALDAANAAQLREPLLLTVFGEMSQAEAGALLNISAKAMETRVYRAKQKLRETPANGPAAAEPAKELDRRGK